LGRDNRLVLIYKFENPLAVHRFNQKFNFEIYENNIETDILKNDLVNTVLKLEDKILKSTDENKAHDGGTGISNKSTTSRFNQYNLFQINETKFLKEIIKEEHKKFLKELGEKQIPIIYGQCWVNILRQNEELKLHNHNASKYSYLSGNICLQVKDTSTWFLTPYLKQKIKSENKNGNINIFPSWLDHYTDKVINNLERITVAFDLVTEEGFLKDIIPEMKHHWEKLEDKP